MVTSASECGSLTTFSTPLMLQGRDFARLPEGCVLALDRLTDLLFAANTWKLHRANESTLSLIDIGKNERLGVRHLKTNVTTREKAHCLSRTFSLLPVNWQRDVGLRIS